MFRILIGLIKGAVLGGAIGFGAYAAGFSGAMNWVVYGLVGAVVGLLVGRPIWRHLLDKSSTLWTAVLKGLFGAGVGVGLYALVMKFFGATQLALPFMNNESHLIQDWQFLLGGAIGAVYGAFVEVDDAPPKAAPAAPPAEKK